MQRGVRSSPIPRTAEPGPRRLGRQRACGRPAGTPRGSGRRCRCRTRRRRRRRRPPGRPGRRSSRRGSAGRRRCRTPPCRSWRSPAGRARRRAPRPLPSVTTPRSIDRERGRLALGERRGAVGRGDVDALDQPRHHQRRPAAPTRSPWPSPSARPGSCPARSAGRPPRSRSRVSGSVLPKYAGKPRSWSSPMPSETPASNRLVPDSFAAWEMKAVLHELATAVLSGMSPSALRRVVAVVLELLAVDGDRRRARAPRCRASARRAAGPGCSRS